MLIRIKMCKYQDQYVDGMKGVQYDSSIPMRIQPTSKRACDV